MTTKTFTGPGGTFEVSTRRNRVYLKEIDGFCSTIRDEFPEPRRTRRLAEMVAAKLAKGE